MKLQWREYIVVLFALVHFCNCYSISTLSSLTNCSVLYTPLGVLDIQKSIYLCAAVLPDLSMPYSYLPNAGNVTVYASMALNNLEEVSELDATVTIDYYFRIYWTDPRLAMPSLWAAIGVSNSFVVSQGIELLPMITNPNSPLVIWQPDLYFIDSRSDTVLAESVLLLPNGTVYWDRHMVSTLSQPYFAYYDYPLDNQILQIRFQSFAFTNGMVNVVFGPTPVSYVTIAGQTGFTYNALWEIQDTSTEILIYNKTTSQAMGISSNIESNVAMVYVKITRRAAGVIFRLTLPITLLLLLVGIGFWNPDRLSRADTAIVLLLSVSALYIVIFSNIPMLGYLTLIDRFVTTMFGLIFLAIVMHQFTAYCQERDKRWPMYKVYIRVVELIGRCVIAPFVMIYFSASFAQPIFNRHLILTILTFLIITLIYLVGWESMGVLSSFKKAMQEIGIKADNPSENDLSTGEMLVFNLFMYKKFGRSPVYHQQHKRKVEQEFNATNYAHGRSVSTDDSSVYTPAASAMLLNEDTRLSEHVRTRFPSGIGAGLSLTSINHPVHHPSNPRLTTLNQAHVHQNPMRSSIDSDDQSYSTTE